jgi:hypothetical protein
MAVWHILLLFEKTSNTNVEGFFKSNLPNKFVDTIKKQQSYRKEPYTKRAMKQL